jgi:hypothetical protein
MLYNIKYAHIFDQLYGVCFISRILFGELAALNVAVFIELLAKFSEIRKCDKLVLLGIGSVLYQIIMAKLHLMYYNAMQDHMF